MKTLNLTVECKANYKTSIEVEDDVDVEEQATQLIKEINKLDKRLIKESQKSNRILGNFLRCVC